MKRRLLAISSAGLLLVAGACFVLQRKSIEVPDDVPDGFPESGFSHAAFERLLERFVTGDGRVRYEAWHADAPASKQLDRYLGALARYSPKNAPERFPTGPDRLAYWLHAYNACVIKAVLANWPIESVHDVTAPIELKAGMGFFWSLRFVLGGEKYNLHDIENDIIRKQFQDPRIHFALNCASESCPPLRPDLPSGDELERYLQDATRDFLGNPSNVAVDHAGKRLTLNAIFDWYRDDFLADLARRGIPASSRSLAAWLAGVAEGDLKQDLEQAAGYEVVFATYDWGLNGG
jgi:hypothetical protein